MNARPITRLASTLALGIAAAIPATAASQAPPGQWQYSASIYGYFPTISGNLNFPPPPGGGSSVEVDADKVVDALKMAFLGALEAHNGRWGAFSDLIYFDLGGSKSETHDFSVGGIGLPAGVTANVNLDLKALAWSLAGEYRVVSQPGFTMDVIAGARYLKFKPRLEYELTGNIGTLPLPERSGNRTTSSDVWDGIIGVKGRATLGAERKWYVPYYLDFGAGQSKKTWQGAAGIGYAFGWGEMAALWRYVDYEFDSDKNVKDLNFNGPMIGATWRW